MSVQQIYTTLDSKTVFKMSSASQEAQRETSSPVTNGCGSDNLPDPSWVGWAVAKFWFGWATMHLDPPIVGLHFRYFYLCKIS